MAHRLYLRLGDRVFHLDHEEWGEGTVVEEMTSVLEGGTCLVRVMFADVSGRSTTTWRATSAATTSGCASSGARAWRSRPSRRGGCRRGAGYREAGTSS